MKKFSATLEIIGMNPFVFVPEEILVEIFADAGKSRGAVPVCGIINGNEYIQTLVKYSGSWRLYINTSILPDSPRRIGEVIDVSIAFDPSDRTLLPHPELIKALDANEEAKRVFEGLSPSLRKEIVRYISYLKSEKSIADNVKRAIGFLLGNNRFIGRDRP